MKIQIDGTNTLNKGAELMLYAILEKLETSFAEAEIFYNPNNASNSIPVKTSLKLNERNVLKYSRYPKAILRRINLTSSFFTSKHPRSFIDVVLDAGGFQFSDQWNNSPDQLKLLDNYYKKLKASNCKIIFLSQAFGPFETEQGKKVVSILDKYADLIIAREQISFDNLIACGADQKKIKIYPDFTLAVAGKLPLNLEHLKGKVCIIPNKKMITHTKSDSTRYLDLMKGLIEHITQSGKDVYLLNHEGDGDQKNL